MRSRTAAQRAAKVGIVYPPGGAGHYPVICRGCGWTDTFYTPTARRKKAWSHVIFHESNELKEWK